MAKSYKINRQTSLYRNPFKLSKFLKNLKIFRIFNLFLLLIILGSIYFFIFSGFYNINNVEIYGNQLVPTSDLLELSNNYLAKKRFFIFHNQNIFFFSKEGLKQEINNLILSDEIKIEKILPNTIRITLKEKIAQLKFSSNEQTYLLDSQGIVIKKHFKKQMPDIFLLNPRVSEVKPEEENDGYLLIANLSNQSISLGDRVLQPEDITFITKLQKDFASKDYLPIAKISIPNTLPQFLGVNLSSGTIIYFNLADAWEKQYNRLEVLINDKIKKENVSRLEYIDLRLGENIYYK